MNLAEIELQIIMYKGYIVASDAAIGNLKQATIRIDDGKPNLRNAKEVIDVGYKGGASSLCSDQVNTSNVNSSLQEDSVNSRIALLQSDTVEFRKIIQQLEAQRAAEIGRLAAIVRQAAAEAARAATEVANKAAEAAKAVASNIL